MKRFAGIIACAAVVALAAGCNRDPIVGGALGRKVTASQFKERYTLYLQSTGDKDNILVREKILNNMLNELLIFDDLHRQGFDRDSVYDEKLQELTLQAMLDAYAKRMTTDTLTVSEEERMAEFRAVNTHVGARYVYSATEEGARRLKERLEEGASFESLAKEVFQDQTLAGNGGSLGFFGHGEMEEPLERAAFALPVGKLSDPVKLQVGYAIIRVDRHVEKPLSSETDYALAKPKLDKAVRDRKTREILRDDAVAIERDLQPQFNEPAVAAALQYWAVRDIWTPLAVEMPTLPDSVSTMPMVTYRGGMWTVGQFYAKAGMMRSRDRRRTRTAADVREVAVGLLTREVLIDRARRAGVDREERVAMQVEKLRSDYLLRRWRSSVLDTLGRRAHWEEDSLRTAFEKNRDQFRIPPMIDVAEILVAQEQKARDIIRLLRHGADFSRLAKEYSLARWTAEKGGEVGYASREMFGPIADTLFGAAPGHVIGPLPVTPLFGVFKVLGKESGRAKTYEEARDDVIAMLLPPRQEKALRNAIDTLRGKGALQVDLQALGTIVVTLN